MPVKEGPYLILPGHRLASANGFIREYHFLIENLLPGIFDPKKGHVVHHVDDDHNNNTPSNLVLCESHGYHMLIHARRRAYRACGNANYRKCWFCSKYDDIKKLHFHKNAAPHHRDCRKKYRRERKLNLIIEALSLLDDEALNKDGGEE